VNPLLVLFAIVLLVAQFVLPRRFAFVPLLIAACHLPNVPVVTSITVVRLLVLTGLLRAAASGKLVWSVRHPLDRLLAFWACWAILSSFGHVAKENYNPLTVHMSLAFDYLGTYLYVRAYLRDQEDIIRFSKCLAVLLLPLALCLLFEKMTGQNLYAVIGAEIQEAWVREGRVRASGPFGISILTGTVGGTCCPLMLLLLRQRPRLAVAGAAACALIVFSSASSGPYMSIIAGLAGVALWRWRSYMRQIRLSVILSIIALALVMKAPVWYLVARIDIAGGSTSWHRAELINQAVGHLGEWWLVGTDYTRHWMPYGIQWSKDHVDITNHYVHIGVRGGLLLVLIFVGILFKSFQFLGRTMRIMRLTRDPAEFMLWCVGASLFAHCVSFMGVPYFDQSYVLLFFVIGAIPALTMDPVHNIAQFTATSLRDSPSLVESLDTSSNARVLSLCSL
jgi:hypothetical protein